ncbi:hypothetical protein [Thermomonospora curvata]|uniref:Uncharacterized protein n=1 Tax=Thermomonospora curvata (strain ATCC 19995 / DSM 43183 / JCM 3096 / KCTC 9072 / NBRC 15933 / NCIMB 10081 / Henssen B9) TaxID=471852 RepID=D1A4J2_THECD|nr:hypothetical protein [Thermomonospora curvata]ACY96227.1 hypothetical protein Tcur_0632 [Thermomonospora curvata DSM 43183]
MGHAEVERVWPRDGRIRIEGRLHEVTGTAGDRWTAELRGRRDPNRVLRFPVRVTAGAFDFAFPITELITPRLRAAAPGTRQVWDVFLVRERDGLRVRAGRHLDDIANRAEVFVYPAQRAGENDEFVVRPFYTPDDHLSVRCGKPQSA